MRVLLDSISGTLHIDLRDKALIGLMLYSFARIGAVVAIKVEDVFTQNRRLWVRLHEKGGKLHDMLLQSQRGNLSACLYRRHGHCCRCQGHCFAPSVVTASLGAAPCIGATPSS